MMDMTRRSVCNGLEGSILMNRPTQWIKISVPLLLALVLPILAACGGSPQAAAPTTAPAATAAASVIAAPARTAVPTMAAMSTPSTNAGGLNKLNHIVVIYQENW